MNDENAKILIALLLKTESGVFLKRSDEGVFEIPSRLLQKNEQPDSAVQELATSLQMPDLGMADVQTSTKNIKMDGQSIVVILTTYFLKGNNVHSSKMVEINEKDVPSVKLSVVAGQLLRAGQTARQDGDEVLENEPNNELNTKTNAMTEPAQNEHKNVHIFSDGGSRGNPGPSACGFVIEDENGIEIYRGGEYLGVTTNNQAEYHGVRLALEKAIELGVESVDFKGDSLLVINQMNGVYKIKNKDLWPIYERIKELVTKFKKVTFTHVYREYNWGADAMVNEILDNHADSVS